MSDTEVFLSSLVVVPFTLTFATLLCIEWYERTRGGY